MWRTARVLVLSLSLLPLFPPFLLFSLPPVPRLPLPFPPSLQPSLSLPLFFSPSLPSSPSFNLSLSLSNSHFWILEGSNATISLNVLIFPDRMLGEYFYTSPPNVHSECLNCFPCMSSLGKVSTTSLHFNVKYMSLSIDNKFHLLLLLMVLSPF